MERDLMKYLLRGADWGSLFLNCFAFECSWYILQKCLESGGFGGFRIDTHGKVVWLFAVHSSRFVNIFVIKILSRAGGLFGMLWPRIMIYGSTCTDIGLCRVWTWNSRTAGAVLGTWSTCVCGVVWLCVFCGLPPSAGVYCTCTHA